MATETTDGLITPVRVYVRKGADADDRSIAFEIPEGISQGEILDNGWGIDGNQALMIVSKRELAKIERDLVEWFRRIGVGITFC